MNIKKLREEMYDIDPKKRERIISRMTDKSWDKDRFELTGIYKFPSGNEYNSFWRSIVMSPEWQAWEKEIDRRMKEHSKKKSEVYTGVWDYMECRDCGWISPEHLADFFNFIRNDKKRS